MEKRHKKILDKIIELEGNCLIGVMCDHCPFNNSCLPRFFTKDTPTRKERYIKAIDTLARSELMLDDVL